MPTWRGACHCGRVAFEVEAEPTHLSECNCSLCHKKGALYLPVSEIHAVRILEGQEQLTEYRFNTGTARHFFCRNCGVHVLHRPRVAPERWSVNARCLEGVDLDALPRQAFDGRNWEASARAEGWNG